MNANQENIPRLGRKESPLGETFSCYISALTHFHLKRKETAPARRPVGNSSIEDPAPWEKRNPTGADIFLLHFCVDPVPSETQGNSTNETAGWQLLH